MLCKSRVCTYIAAFAISTLLLPTCKHSKKAVAVLDYLFFQHWRRHVRYKVTYDASIQRDQQYIVAEFPHGVRLERPFVCGCPAPLLSHFHDIFQDPASQFHCPWPRMMLLVAALELGGQQREHCSAGVSLGRANARKPLGLAALHNHQLTGCECAVHDPDVAALHVHWCVSLPLPLSACGLCRDPLSVH